MERSTLVRLVPLLLLAAPAFALDSKQFYCKKSPDQNPVYTNYAVRGCGPGGTATKDPQAACIYARVGCTLVGEPALQAARLLYGKEFSALKAEQKEDVVQLVTPYAWVKTDDRSIAELQRLTEADQARFLRKAELNRTATLTDTKDEALFQKLRALPKAEMFVSTLICKPKASTPGLCPPVNECKDDFYYNPRPAQISGADDTNTPDSPVLPGKLTPVGNSTVNGG